jgi:hypothetical protein
MIRFGPRCLFVLALLPFLPWPLAADPRLSSDFDVQVPDPRAMLPFDQERPIYFVAAETSPAAWEKLPAFWIGGGSFDSATEAADIQKALMAILTK